MGSRRRPWQAGPPHVASRRRAAHIVRKDVRPNTPTPRQRPFRIPTGGAPEMFRRRSVNPCQHSPMSMPEESPRTELRCGSDGRTGHGPPSQPRRMQGAATARCSPCMSGCSPSLRRHDCGRPTAAAACALLGALHNASVKLHAAGGCIPNRHRPHAARHQRQLARAVGTACTQACSCMLHRRQPAHRAPRATHLAGNANREGNRQTVKI